MFTDLNDETFDKSVASSEGSLNLIASQNISLFGSMCRFFRCPSFSLNH